ncbi:MAG TPA: DNA methyltransferase, partial [Candidatus Pacearchaeota archaeon]|nr:DNA methyltransferase [Candidatus Pacearchaeota archaeon]
FEKAIENPRGVKDGDLWQLGDHRLYIGDATKKESWENVLGDERFDFMFTDPPYRIGYGIGTRKQKTKNGFKLQNFRTYPTIGVTNKEGKPIDLEKSPLGKMNKYFGAKKDRGYLGVDIKGGIPEYDEWLSIANEFQNTTGANVMIFENWKNTVDLWKAIEKYWKIKNMVIWWLPNRHQGFSAKYRFFSKYDIAPLAGEGVENNDYEAELEDYLHEKGQKLLDTYEVILYGQKGKSEWGRYKRSKWAKVSDHITWTAETEKSSGQNIIFGTKPVQILVPYVKILSPRNGIVMEPFGGSGSTMIACEIMKRRARVIEISNIYGEVILERWSKFTGKQPQ